MFENQNKICNVMSDMNIESLATKAVELNQRADEAERMLKFIGDETKEERACDIVQIRKKIEQMKKIAALYLDVYKELKNNISDVGL